jgi:ribosome-associated toxin RatA of RatAB toxin-antitoxin module
MGVQRAERHGEIDAPREACWAILLDVESYPEWQPAVESAVVHERDDEGRGKLVEFTADAVVRRIRYVVRYHYDEPGRMWWDLVEGDVKAGDGEFVLEVLSPDRTRATYRLMTDLGFYVPGPLLRKGTEKLMGGVVKGLAGRAAT